MTTLTLEKTLSGFVTSNRAHSRVSAPAQGERRNLCVLKATWRDWLSKVRHAVEPGWSPETQVRIWAPPLIRSAAADASRRLSLQFPRLQEGDRDSPRLHSPLGIQRGAGRQVPRALRAQSGQEPTASAAVGSPRANKNNAETQRRCKLKGFISNTRDYSGCCSLNRAF